MMNFAGQLRGGNEQRIKDMEAGPDLQSDGLMWEAGSLVERDFSCEQYRWSKEQLPFIV